MNLLKIEGRLELLANVALIINNVMKSDASFCKWLQ